ncbi:MAG: GNAT family N-acetyltransferase [Candidatus Heimdallarchaeota archaeon]
MKPRFVMGKKEDVQLNNLDSFIELMQLYRQEQLPYPAPTFEFWMKVWETPNLEEEEEFWVIALDENDRAIGYGLASWSIKYDNLDKAILRIFVKKKERRKGLGTQIISQLIENTPEQIKVISLGTVTTTDDGLQYLKSLKLEKCYEEIFQYVDLEKTDVNKIMKIADEQREKATNLGYDIKFIEGLDFASQLDYPKYIQLVERIWNDMPIEDLHQEKLVMDQERYESYIKYMMGFGGRLLTVVLVHKETNDPIGYTNIFLNDYHPQVVQQEDTGVLHEHRGKGLGFVLKMIMFEKIFDETKAKYWSTGNAVSNQHMIRINTELNHEKFASFLVFEFKKEEWSELLK